MPNHCQYKYKSKSIFYQSIQEAVVNPQTKNRSVSGSNRGAKLYKTLIIIAIDTNLRLKTLFVGGAAFCAIQKCRYTKCTMNIKKSG